MKTVPSWVCQDSITFYLTVIDRVRPEASAVRHVTETICRMGSENGFEGLFQQRHSDQASSDGRLCGGIVSCGAAPGANRSEAATDCRFPRSSSDRNYGCR